MPADDQIRNTLQNMPTKQKVTILATIVIVIIVIWQLIGLFSGSSAPSPDTSKLPPKTAMNPNAPTGTVTKAPMSDVKPGTIATQIKNQANTIPQETAVAKAEYQLEQEKSEKRYLKQLSDLEQLKLERQIEETNQAIAVAKLATITAEKNTATLLTRPIPVVAGNAYANQLVTPTRSDTTTPPAGDTANAAAGAPTAPEMLAPPIMDATYTVISVSMQFNQWSAVIGSQGKLYNVSIGDTLPVDGSVIVSINKNGVTLKKDNKTRKISITTAI